MLIFVVSSIVTIIMVIAIIRIQGLRSYFDDEFLLCVETPEGYIRRSKLTFITANRWVDYDNSKDKLKNLNITTSSRNLKLFKFWDFDYKRMIAYNKAV